ncbi:hypothetical protein [Saccharothrix obliqua]|uniref:hypothetical protein n=1 Tax=Saccharothrix obliqua TaxID=2861747 RepID=UPI0027E2860D|nr:hypothetical protein [Saccharothrix obliqua]
MEKVVVSFSAPAARVVLVDWPTSTADPASATELVDAARAVERLDRTARVARVPVESPPSNSASTPARANTGPLPTTIPTAPVAPRTATRHRGTTHPGTADLVVTSWRPSLPCGIGAADLVALFAARLLRLGGILVVLTRCDWTSGELLDLTGAAVTAGQNADLLYLQHIVAVHTPVHDGRFELPGAHPGHPHSADSKDPRTRARRIASEHRRAPEPHRRIHSDVLVFAQPHDHQPPPSPHQDSRLRSGDLR